MNNSRTNELRIRQIGTLAMDLLSTLNIASVFGVNSKGIFIKSHNDRMIFLSYEKYRGPFTVNLTGDIQLLSSCSPGETVVVSQEEMLFPDLGIRISTSNAKMWRPPLPMGSPLDTEDRKNLIHKMALSAYQRKSGVGLSEMLPLLVGLSSEDIKRDNQYYNLKENITKIRSHIANGDLSSLLQNIKPFLGQGSGLTPSGDDFVMGLLLGLNRWRSVLKLSKNLSSFNDRVVDAAYRCTTTVSANLIECAALGLADERLIQAVDFLVIGKYKHSNTLSGLLNWGGSSGVDALVGMVTAFLPV